MLCVYLRPWTLNPVDASQTNPLLSDLGKCLLVGDELVPVWPSLPAEVPAQETPFSPSVQPGETTHRGSRRTSLPRIDLRSPEQPKNE